MLEDMRWHRVQSADLADTAAAGRHGILQVEVEGGEIRCFPSENNSRF